MKHLTEEQAQRQIEELQAHIESVRAAKKKEHFPKYDDKYHPPSISTRRFYQNDKFGYEYIFFNAAHRDKASADKHMEIIRYMVDLAREEEPMDWESDDTAKFSIVWDGQKNEPIININTRIQHQGSFYLPSKESLQKVIDKFGDDLRVLFGMSLKEG